MHNHLNLWTGLCFGTVGLYFHRKYSLRESDQVPENGGDCLGDI